MCQWVYIKIIFSQEWLRDNSGDNISHKNPFMENILFIIGIGKIF